VNGCDCPAATRVPHPAGQCELCRYCRALNDDGHPEGRCLNDKDRQHLTYSARVLTEAANAAAAARRHWPTCRLCGERYAESPKYEGRTLHCGRVACRLAHAHAAEAAA
jgi:hypothetical protein